MTLLHEHLADLPGCDQTARDAVLEMAGNRITANGNGALILSGNITATGATSTLQLTGQTGGYFNPFTNRVDGIISEGANVLSIAMPNVGDDDRYGITGRWALTNAAKHSSAQHLFVKLQCDGAFWNLDICDDGDKTPEVVNGGGLRGMQERFDGLGGTLSWSAVAGMPLRATWPVRV